MFLVFNKEKIQTYIVSVLTVAVLITIANVRKVETIQTSSQEKELPIYNVQTDEKKVAEALIKLCVLPEQVKTYLERYNVNSKLLKYSPKIYNTSLIKVELFCHHSNICLGITFCFFPLFARK